MKLYYARYDWIIDFSNSYIHKDLNTLKLVLENESLNLISWFEDNFMKANPDKFQAICAGKKCHDHIKSFRIGDTDISCEDNVSLLGVNIDFMLKFDDHVSDICKKASKQLAVLKRLGRFLTKQGKLVIYNSFIASNFSYCPVSLKSVKKCQEVTRSVMKCEEASRAFFFVFFTVFIVYLHFIKFN